MLCRLAVQVLASGFLQQELAELVEQQPDMQVVTRSPAVSLVCASSDWQACLRRGPAGRCACPPASVVFITDGRPADLGRAARLGLQVFWHPEDTAAALVEAIRCAARRRPFC